MGSASVQSIQFHYLSTNFKFPSRSILKTFLLKIFEKEGHSVRAINFIFCNDEYLLSLNQQHLNHNTYTDILTFEFSNLNEPLVADIYISVERIKENSMLFHSGFLKELHRVIFHGALHLCGYKDKQKKEVQIMREKEDFYLNQYFVSRETS